MPLSFAKQLSGIQKSHKLAVSLERAYDYAREGGRDQVTLEHFLLALTEDSEAIAVLNACKVDLDRLRTDVAGFIGRAGGGPMSGADPVADPQLLRIIMHAEAAAKQSGRPQLNGGIVLAAIVGDGTSNAAELLQGQGLTFQGTLKALQTSAGSASPAPPQSQTAAKVEPTTAAAAPLPASHKVQDAINATASSTPGREATVAEAASTEDVLASVRERIKAKRRGTSNEPVAAQKAERDAAPAQAQSAPAAAPQPIIVTTGQDGPQASAATPAELADKWARAIDGPDTIPHDQDTPQTAATPGPVAAAAPAPSPVQAAADAPAAHPDVGQAAYTGSYPEAVGLESPLAPVQPAQVDVGAAPAMEPWPEPRDQQQQLQPNAPSPDQPMNGTIAGAGYPAADTAVAPVNYAPPPVSNAPPRARAPQPTVPRQTRPAPAPAMPAAPAPQRQPQQGVRARAPAASVESGQLLETIPRFMKVAIPATVEVRIARDKLETAGKGMQGAAPVQRHDLYVTKAMSVKLKAPDGGFWIETASPETQWIENKLGLLHDDFASWRWTVTPRRRGTARLQLVVSARTVGTDGLAAETQLPDQVVTVKVRMNYKKSFKKLGGWALAALVGGIISALGGGLFTGGSSALQRWLAIIGL